jgi:hypothetical protein
MKTLLLALLVCLCAAAPARADVITFQRGSTGSAGITGFRWPSRPPQRVPEPGTLSLIAMGAVAAVAARRRARRN